MTDKSRWKNKNRNILLGVKEGVTAVTKPFKSTVKGAIKGVKKIAEPFIKEAVVLEGATKLLKGLKPKEKKKD